MPILVIVLLATYSLQIQPRLTCYICSYVQNYETTESRLKREFDVYGPIKRVGIFENSQGGSVRGSFVLQLCPYLFFLFRNSAIQTVLNFLSYGRMRLSSQQYQYGSPYLFIKKKGQINKACVFYALVKIRWYFSGNMVECINLLRCITV